MAANHTSLRSTNEERVAACRKRSRIAARGAGATVLLAATLITSLCLPIPGVAAEPAGAAKPTTSVADRLKQPVTLSFKRDTLAAAMELLSDEIDTPIEIVGDDLIFEGITKNQSFGIDEFDKPAGDTLRKILLRVNPDGKLVYVIKPRKLGGEDMIFVTTRAAAKKRGDKLPAELKSEPN